MNTALPAYAQQYDKIIQAYFKDEIKPMLPKFCFCGTLDPEWHNSNLFYSLKEYRRMEYALLFTGLYLTVKLSVSGSHEMDVEFEDAIFSGMCAALDVLKQIHIERGEIIDDVPVFTKREPKK